MLSCPARRQSSHYLPAEALPCCCGLHPAAGYALWRSLSVVAGCLGNGRLHQQWACTSVGADCLGNGRRPLPTELHRPGFSCVLREPLHQERLESLFCLSHCATPNTVSLESPRLAHCPSPVQSQAQPSQVADCQFNRAPRPVHFVWSTVEHHCATAPAAGCTSQSLCLVSRVSFIPGNFPVLWATKIHLEMRP